MGIFLKINVAMWKFTMIRSWLRWRFGFEQPFNFITSLKELHASTDRLGFEIPLLRFLFDVESFTWIIFSHTGGKRDWLNNT